MPLAYLAAQTHGLTEEAANILAAAGLETPPTIPENGQLLKTPTPILRQQDANWPHLPVSRSFFEQGLFGGVPATAAPAVPEQQVMQDVNTWGDADADFTELPADRAGLNGTNAPVDVDVAEGEGWGFEDDLDIPAAPEAAANTSSDSSSAVTSISPGSNFADQWVRNSALAADHAAAGSFESGMQLLSRQIGATNFSPLKPLFLTLWQASKAYMPCNASLPSLALPLQRRADSKPLPHVPYNLQNLLTKLQEAYAATTSGR